MEPVQLAPQTANVLIQIYLIVKEMYVLHALKIITHVPQLNGVILIPTHAHLAQVQASAQLLISVILIMVNAQCVPLMPNATPYFV